MTACCKVIVVGGGMVGATVAAILARAGISVTLLESRPPQRHWEPDSVDLRVSALTPASQKILETLGVWSDMCEMGVSPYRHMRVWEMDPMRGLVFDGAEVGEDILGHIVENRVAVTALWNSLENLEAVTIVTPARVCGLQTLADGVRLRLEDGRCLRAELIIAADGQASTIRSLAGIGVSGWNYGQEALVATVWPEKFHNQTAYQRFLEEGPLAFLPLQNGACSIVWSASSATTRNHLALDDREFLRCLTEASGGILGNIERIGARASFPLKLQYADRYSDERVVLVGDAAHVIHPLAGQGANLGLLDAAVLAENLVEQRNQGRSLGCGRAVRRYERWRKADNLQMMAAMDALKRGFSFANGPLGWLRSSGMNGINHVKPLKKYLARYAMGYRPDLPRMAEGIPCWSDQPD